VSIAPGGAVCRTLCDAPSWLWAACGSGARGVGLPCRRRRAGARLVGAWHLGRPTLERRCGPHTRGPAGTASRPPPAGAAAPSGTACGGHSACARLTPGGHAGPRGSRGRSPRVLGRRAMGGLVPPAGGGVDAAVRPPRSGETAAHPRDASRGSGLRDRDVGVEWGGQT
jgi:hypothetical protein